MDWKEDSFKRAIGDTLATQKTAVFMWIGQSVLGVGGAGLFTAVAPNNASALEQALRAVGGGLLGLCVAFFATFAFNLIRAPYRQRNEARKRLYKLKNPMAALTASSVRFQWEPIQLDMIFSWYSVTVTFSCGPQPDSIQNVWGTIKPATVDVPLTWMPAEAAATGFLGIVPPAVAYFTRNQYFAANETMTKTFLFIDTFSHLRDGNTLNTMRVFVRERGGYVHEFPMIPTPDMRGSQK